MATNLDIIKRAMKKIHALAAGTEPTSVQAAAGMDSLQGLIVELIGQGTLGRLHDVLASSDYTAYENDRIHAAAGVTVTLPTTITSEIFWADPDIYGGSSYGGYGGGRDYGFGGPSGAYRTDCPRSPWDRTPIVVIDSAGEATYYVWSSYGGGWSAINTLAQQDEFPFAVQFENGFAAMLAERIVDDFAQELGSSTAKQAAACRQMLSAKYDSVSLPAGVARRGTGTGTAPTPPVTSPSLDFSISTNSQYIPCLPL